MKGCYWCARRKGLLCKRANRKTWKIVGVESVEELEQRKFSIGNKCDDFTEEAEKVTYT